MAGELKDEILYDHNHDGIDRRGFLKCMAWRRYGSQVCDELNACVTDH